MAQVEAAVERDPGQVRLRFDVVLDSDEVTALQTADGMVQMGPVQVKNQNVFLTISKEAVVNPP